MAVCTQAQDLRPIGSFSGDSIKVGQQISYSLSFRHSKQAQVIFPDTTFDFYPFELISKSYFPTITSEEISHDSSVYLLRTFETSPAISYTLPVFILSGKDSISIFSNPDTVYLKQYISEIPKDITLKENIHIIPLKKRVNVPFILSGLFIVFTIGFITFMLFRKKITRKYNIYILRKTHNSFLQSYEQLEKEFMKTLDIRLLEKCLHQWKVYIAKLEHKPINTYTTTELIKLYDHEKLSHSLQLIDKTIYGGQHFKKTEDPLRTLKKFSNKKYMSIKSEMIKS
ncbi:MAG: hypothetical protein ACK4ND_14660 [Cytophagaceae bacterium]